MALKQKRNQKVEEDNVRPSFDQEAGVQEANAAAEPKEGAPAVKEHAPEKKSGRARTVKLMNVKKYAITCMESRLVFKPNVLVEVKSSDMTKFIKGQIAAGVLVEA